MSGVGLHVAPEAVVGRLEAAAEPESRGEEIRRAVVDATGSEAVLVRVVERVPDERQARAPTPDGGPCTRDGQVDDVRLNGVQADVAKSGRRRGCDVDGVFGDELGPVLAVASRSGTRRPDQTGGPIWCS